MLVTEALTKRVIPTRTRTLRTTYVAPTLDDLVPNLNMSVLKGELSGMDVQCADGVANLYREVLRNQEYLSSSVSDAFSRLSDVCLSDGYDDIDWANVDGGYLQGQMIACPEAIWTEIQHLCELSQAIGPCDDNGEIWQADYVFYDNGRDPTTAAVWQNLSGGTIANLEIVLNNHDPLSATWSNEATMSPHALSTLISHMKAQIANSTIRSVMATALDVVSDKFDVTTIAMAAGYTVASLSSDAKEFLSQCAVAISNVKGMRPRAVVGAVINRIFKSSSSSVNDTADGYSFTPIDRFAMRSVISVPWAQIATAATTVAGAIVTCLAPAAGIVISGAGVLFGKVQELIGNASYVGKYNDDAQFFSYAYPAIQLTVTGSKFAQLIAAASSSTLTADMVTGLNSLLLSTPFSDRLCWCSNPSDSVIDTASLNWEDHLKPIVLTNSQLASLIPGSMTFSGTLPNGTFSSGCMMGDVPRPSGQFASIVTDQDEVTRNCLFNSICLYVAAEEKESLSRPLSIQGASTNPSDYRASNAAGSSAIDIAYALCSIMIDHPVYYGGSAAMVIPSWEQIEGLLHLIGSGISNSNAQTGLSNLFSDATYYSGVSLNPGLSTDFSFRYEPPRFTLRSLVISGAVVLAVAALATAAAIGTVKVKKSIVRKRTALYADCQAKREAFQKNPSDNDLYKAYRKSVKKNNWFTKFFGGSAVNMTDGYLVGDNISVSDSQSEMTNIADMVTTLRGDNAGYTSDPTIASVTRLIAG